MHLDKPVRRVEVAAAFGLAAEAHRQAPRGRLTLYGV